MSIQTRLARDRYSPMILQVPNKDELDKHIPFDHNTKRMLHKHDILRKVHNIYYLPPKGRWRSTYSSVIDDYAKIHGHESRSWFFIVKMLYMRYLYFLKFPEKYGYSFEHYGIIWYNASLFQMRKAILKQMWLRGEIPILRDMNSPSSHQYYDLVKPMRFDYTKPRAELLFEIFSTIKHVYKGNVATQALRDERRAIKRK